MSKNASFPADAADSDGGVDRSGRVFSFGYLVHDVSRVRRTVMDHIMRPYGITRSQWSVLSALSRGGDDGMTQVDLARLLEVGKVTVGGLVDRLEASGQVERRADPADRRAKRVHVSDKGREVLRLMIEVASDANARILSTSTPEEIAICEQVLSRAKIQLKELLNERTAASEISVTHTNDKG